MPRKNFSATPASKPKVPRALLALAELAAFALEELSDGMGLPHPDRFHALFIDGFVPKTEQFKQLEHVQLAELERLVENALAGGPTNGLEAREPERTHARRLVAALFDVGEMPLKDLARDYFKLRAREKAKPKPKTSTPAKPKAGAKKPAAKKGGKKSAKERSSAWAEKKPKTKAATPKRKQLPLAGTDAEAGHA
jgi:hypothetical protein